MIRIQAPPNGDAYVPSSRPPHSRHLDEAPSPAPAPRWKPRAFPTSSPVQSRQSRLVGRIEFGECRACLSRYHSDVYASQLVVLVTSVNAAVCAAKKYRILPGRQVHHLGAKLPRLRQLLCKNVVRPDFCAPPVCSTRRRWFRIRSALPVCCNTAPATLGSRAQNLMDIKVNAGFPALCGCTEADLEPVFADQPKGLPRRGPGARRRQQPRPSRPAPAFQRPPMHRPSSTVPMGPAPDCRPPPPGSDISATALSPDGI